VGVNVYCVSNCDIQINGREVIIVNI